MLLTKNVIHKYNRNQEISFPDLHCASGESLLLLGQSGVGKTTLLHVLGGLLKPTKGEVMLGDKNIYSISARTLDRYRGDNIGIVFQQPHFVSALTVLENIELAQKMGVGSSDRKKINAVLESLNIADKKNAYPQTLSQGEKQRASIARAVINDPKLILADEPTSALDDLSCSESIKLLKNQSKELGASLVIVTHDSRLKDVFTNKIILE